MSTFTTRVLTLACLAASLAFFAGCGPKPVEPYQQQKAGAGKSKGKAGSTFYDYGEPAAAAADAAENSGSADAGLLDSLPDAQTAAPAVEPLTAGSGRSDGAAGFDDKQSADYKRKNGRSSPQMKSIFYDFDQSAVRNDQVAKMEANARHLKQNPGSKVVIEGNCDERGTKEYNLALGERRAIAARKYLSSLGVAGGRIRTISYGEERPLFPGAEEADYEMNRRSDFILE